MVLFNRVGVKINNYFLSNLKPIQVVVLASLAQLLVFVELARCARSIQIEIKDVICT